MRRIAILLLMSVWFVLGDRGASRSQEDPEQASASAKLPRNLQSVLEHTRPLKYPLGQRLPLHVLPITGSLQGVDDVEAKRVLEQLANRGIAMTVVWNYDVRDKTLLEGLRIGKLQQQLGLRVSVNANACLYSFFDGSEATFHIDRDGKKFYDSSFSSRRMGCPYTLKSRQSAIKEQVEFFLRGYKKAEVGIDFIFADWEIDGPIEWNGAWDSSRRCKRCLKNITEISDFRRFQATVRRIRSDLQRVVFSSPVTTYFPDALVGNYGVYPHGGHRYWYDYFEKSVAGAPYRADQRARYREWFHEFPLTGYTFAMPVVYTWYDTFNWYDFENLDYRWFYNMLLVATNAARQTPQNIPIISFVHWTTTAPPAMPDPRVRQLGAKNYRELLWHMLLRGHDGLFLWCTDSELVKEIRILHEVFAAALKYREFLDDGEPILFDVPSSPAPVISVLRAGKRVLVRRTDFDKSSGTVKIMVGNQELNIPRADGRCHIYELR